MIDSCVEFLVAIHGLGPCAVNFTCVVSTDVEPCSIVSLKSGISVTPPAVNLIDVFGWSLTRCVGDTHYKKMFIQSLLAFSYYWVGVASVTLTTEPFSFTLSVTPHGKGSPFDNPVKLCQNIIINEVAIIIVFKATESDVG